MRPLYHLYLFNSKVKIYNPVELENFNDVFHYQNIKIYTVYRHDSPRTSVWFYTYLRIVLFVYS